MSHGNGFKSKEDQKSKTESNGVISLSSHRKKKATENSPFESFAPADEAAVTVSSPSTLEKNPEPLVNFGEVRNQKMEEKRRKTQRIFFKNLLGVYSVTSEARMRRIDIVDVSEDGCAFQVPFHAEKVWPNQSEDFPIRLYFSPDTYLEVRVKIVNSRPYIENGDRYIRYGCLVDQSLGSYACYQQFIRFMLSYSECAHRDLGDASAFYL